MTNLNAIIKSEILKSKNIDSPAIIYSRKALNFNIRQILKERVSIKHNSLKVLYSIKACNNLKIISLISERVDGFSVSSQQELNVVRQFSNKLISATGFEYDDFKPNNKDFTFYFNSLEQIKRYLKKSCNKSKMKISLRIEAPNTLYTKSNTFSHFGFTIQQLKELNAMSKKFNFTIHGILIHQENKVYSDQIKLREFIYRVLSLNIMKNVEVINLGGGWDNIFLKKQLAKFIIGLNIPAKYEIHIEPGSALVRTIGILKAKVIDQTLKHDYQYVILNTSQFNNSSWYVPKIIAVKNLVNTNSMPMPALVLWKYLLRKRLFWKNKKICFCFK